MKRHLISLLLISSTVSAIAQETLQTVTDNGNTTNNRIIVNRTIVPSSRITAYGYNQGYFDIFNNTNNSVSLDLLRSDGAKVFSIDGHSMDSYFGGKIGIGTLTPSSKLDINLGAGSDNGTVGLKIGSVDNYPSLELGVENAYDAQIRTYGNDLNLYAGHFRDKINTSSEDHSIKFFTSKKGSTDWSSVKMILNEDGYLGLGTATPKERLSVNGKIRAKEVKIETANWPDYVFDPSYKNTSLEDLESFIKSNRHLPGVPSAKQVADNGVELGEMNKILLQKIEELTLHLIDKEKTLQELVKRIDRLEKNK